MMSLPIARLRRSLRKVLDRLRSMGLLPNQTSVSLEHLSLTYLKQVAGVLVPEARVEARRNFEKAHSKVRTPPISRHSRVLSQIHQRLLHKGTPPHGSYEKSAHNVSRWSTEMHDAFVIVWVLFLY